MTDSAKKDFCGACGDKRAQKHYTVQIETPRLILREMASADVDALYAITKQPGFGFHYFDGSRESVEKFVQKCIDTRGIDPHTGARSNFMLAVQTKDDGKLIGFASVEKVVYRKKPDGTFEGFTTQEGIVYDENTAALMEPNFFIDPPLQNKGYGREAVINVMKYVFDNLGVDGLNATIEANNKPSLNVAYTEGYKDSGKEISFDTNQGPKSYMILTLTRADFYEKRKNDRKPLILNTGAAGPKGPAP